MRSFYVITIVIVVLLSLSPFFFLPRQEEAGRPGEIVSYNTYWNKVKSIDPATCGDTMSATIQGAFYESLYAYEYLMRPLKLVPQLAEDFPVASADKLTYTIRIRKDIRYHRNPCFGMQNGQAKTRCIQADDFVLAFKRIADYHVTTDLSLAFIEDKIVGVKAFRDRTRQYAKGDFSRYDKEDLPGVKALDEHTLQFRLTAPWPQLLYVLAINCYAPVPREMVDYYLTSKAAGPGRREPLPIGERPTEIYEADAAVGTGGFYLAERVEGNRIVLRRNPDFRDERYPSVPDLSKLTPAERESVQKDIAAGLYQDAGKKIPFNDVNHLTFTEESNPMWMLFLTRQVDTAYVPQELYTQIVAPDRELAEQWRKEGIQLIKYTEPAIYWYCFNMQDKVVGRSKSLRQAMSLCYDADQDIESLWNGRGIRATNCIPSDLEAHAEAGPSPYARLDLPAAKVKIEAARQELAEAGVIRPGQAIPTLSLDLGGRDERTRRMGEFAQQQFKKIGLDVAIELNDWPTLQSKLHNKQVQLVQIGWHADYPDPENFLQLYYTPNIKRGTSQSNYSNPEFDRLFEQAAVMMPSPQRTEIYVKLVRMISEDCPVLLQREPVNFFLAHSWMHNIKPHPIGYGFGMYRRVDPEAREKAGGR